MLYKVVLTFESEDEILWCEHSNKSNWAVPSRGTVYYMYALLQGGCNFGVCGWNLRVRPFKWKLLSSNFDLIFRYLGRDPFNQNFRKFRSKTQWIVSVQPEKFRRNWSTFWDSFEVDHFSWSDRSPTGLNFGWMDRAPRTN